jgi:two-component system sensor histidine kinase BaeS
VRFTILSKFFLSFLITGILLVGLMIGVMQFYTFQNFGDYVDQTQLAQLSGLAEQLGNEYEKNNGWSFLKNNHQEWTRIFIKAGLINPTLNARTEHSTISPLRPSGPPPRQPSGQPPERGTLEIGPRVSLFDLEYQRVMGKARSKEGHVFKPIQLEDETVGYLGLKKLEAMSNPMDQYFIKQQKEVIYLVGGLFLIASVLISFTLASQLLSPIKELSRATEDLAKRRFDTKLAITTTDELGQLAGDFNHMIARLGEYELKQKQWLSDISHELRTPLSILIGEIDAVQDGIRKPDPMVIKSIQAEVFHLKRLIDDLHTLATEESKTLQLEKVPLDIVSLLRETQEKFSDSFEEKGVVKILKLENTGKHIVLGDPDRIIQLFSNLLKNSLRYTDSPGELIIRQEQSKKLITIHLEDTSPGVPAEMMDRIFDRLFRVDSSRSRKTGGSGIGLAICKNIVERHYGKISATPSESGGLKITMEFPTI